MNYVFLALWLADVIWWWASPATHRSRSAAAEQLRRAAFVFMFVNGAIIFASGVGRVIGIASVVVALTGFGRHGENRRALPPSAV